MAMDLGLGKMLVNLSRATMDTYVDSDILDAVRSDGEAADISGIDGDGDLFAAGLRRVVVKDHDDDD